MESIPEIALKRSAIISRSDRTASLQSGLNYVTQLEAQVLEAPSLTELMGVVKAWWLEIDPLFRLEQPVDRVSNLLVDKGISQDVDSAFKVIVKYAKKPKDARTLTYEDFNKVFCKCLYKDALTNLLESLSDPNS